MTRYVEAFSWTLVELAKWRRKNPGARFRVRRYTSRG